MGLREDQRIYPEDLKSAGCTLSKRQFTSVGRRYPHITVGDKRLEYISANSWLVRSVHDPKRLRKEDIDSGKWSFIHWD